MKKLIVALITTQILLSTNLVFALRINEKHSYKDYTNVDVSNTDPADWSNTEVIGTCFYREAEWSEDRLGSRPPAIMRRYLPLGITNVAVKNCNYDNGAKQLGLTIDPSCSNRRIAVQSDLQDWLCDADNKPIEPLMKERYERAGVSVDPNDLPDHKMTEAEYRVLEETLRNEGISPIN